MPIFRILKDDQPIQNVQIRHRLNTEIEIKGFPGIIAEFYVMDACHKANYRYFHDWQELEEWQRAKIVGHYYAAFMIEGHKNDTVQEKIKRDSRKRGSR